MKKLLLICLVALTLLYAKESVEFNYAKKDTNRKFPTNQDYLLSYNNILENVRTSVINISTQKNMHNQSSYTNPRVPQDRFQRSLGSGVIISKNGYIVTNNHVVEGADKIKVTIAGDKKEYEAKLIGRDEKSDIAIVKIEAKNLNAITFYNSDDVKVGDIVFALGNPFGVGETITQGIVSATGRSSVGIVEYENFIQTDASINPGNSGGALINSTGNLIGINSAIISRSGGNVGIGFAIPSNMVTSIATQLINNGKFTRAYLGVAITDVSEDMSSFYDNRFGALITSIEEDTPALKAGLKRGDLIVGINNKEIDSASELKNIIGSYSPDKTVKIEFLRDKKVYIKDVKLGSLDRVAATVSTLDYKGITIKPLDSKTNIDGVLVFEIKAQSEAQNIGISIGDIIIQIENREIKGIDDFKIATKTNRKKRIYIYRKGTIFAIVL
ncbi:MAG: trypsin-like peptidase domain-containing protein [Sulfurimonas sp.]|nr:trypsin-like peptidase domain-containing protein [Sulfurimonas sp.]